LKKILAILLLALFGLPAVQPLFALGTGSESKLAACCRRDGKHHCAGMAAMDQTQGDSISAIPHCCESFPKAVSPADHHDLTLDTAALAFAEIVSHPALRPQTEARARVALDRSRQKRGPPAARLS
jgi:hypothetical protein